MTPLQDVVERVLSLSSADACIVIARRVSAVNVRWANNTVTTNGDADDTQLTVISVVGRRAGSVTRSHFPNDRLEAIVRESEAACRRSPEAPDYMPMLDGDGMPADWATPAADNEFAVFDPLVPQLGAMFQAARAASVSTFGYAEHQAATTLVGASSGLRRRHTERIGKIEITGKSPDYQLSTWVGQATRDFRDIDLRAMFARVQERLRWSALSSVALPAGHYEVLLEPSCAADLALAAYSFMARRDADEGRSPYSRPGGTRIGERLFGDATLYSDPLEAGIETAPFFWSTESGEAASIFDNGFGLHRTDWVHEGALRHLVTPRYWAVAAGLPAPRPFVSNLVLDGAGPSMDQMIEETERALLVNCLWYIRPVDPQTALLTGLTRDGVFLVERGRVVGAVNNFRWNMSPIAALAQASQIGKTGLALPREHDEFLRAKAPALRIARFNMSSVSEAS